MTALELTIGGAIRIRSDAGNVLVLMVRKGAKPNTVMLEFSGSGGMLVSEESLLQKVTWVISPQPAAESA